MSSSSAPSSSSPAPSGVSSSSASPIYPFPVPATALSSLILRTASFVRQSGPAFANELAARNRQNAKFAFLSPESPFHPFYQFAVQWGDQTIEKIEELKKKHEEEEEAKRQQSETKDTEASVDSRSVVASLDSFRVRLASTIAQANLLDEQFRRLAPPFSDRRRFVRTPPVPAFVPPLLSSLIRLSARYPAHFFHSPSPQLLENLPFLDSSHPANLYFRDLAKKFQQIKSDQIHSKSGSGSTAHSASASNAADDKRILLESMKSALPIEIARYYTSLTPMTSGPGSSASARSPFEFSSSSGDSDAAAAIDWHHFTVVSTVEYSPDELQYLPEPKHSMEEIHRTIELAVRALEESENEREKEKKDVEMGTEGNGTSIAERAAPASAASASSRSLTAICPLCGQSVPVDSLDSHMKIELLDPNWKKDKDIRLERQKENTTFAEPDAILQNLKRMQNAREGGSAAAGAAQQSATGAVREREAEENAARKRARMETDPLLSEPRERPVVNRPAPPVSQLPVTPAPVAPAPAPAPVPAAAAPARPPLVSEEEFLATNPVDPVQVLIQLNVPSDSGVSGVSQYTVTTPLRTTIEQLKTALAAQYAVVHPLKSAFPIPLNRLKLSFASGGFLNRDQFTLAAYNFQSHETVIVGVKERGGKKK